MWKKKKVRAGVLLYAITIAGIFSLLLQFYLNRQVAHQQTYVLNKEKLVAFAMAKKSHQKATLKSGERTFNLGKVTYKDNPKGFIINVNTYKHHFEFILPTLKKVEEQADKTVNKEKNPGKHVTRDERNEDKLPQVNERPVQESSKKAD